MLKLDRSLSDAVRKLHEESLLWTGSPHSPPCFSRPLPQLGGNHSRGKARSVRGKLVQPSDRCAANQQEADCRGEPRREHRVERLFPPSHSRRGGKSADNPMARSSQCIPSSFGSLCASPLLEASLGGVSSRQGLPQEGVRLIPSRGVFQEAARSCHAKLLRGFGRGISLSLSRSPGLHKGCRLGDGGRHALPSCSPSPIPQGGSLLGPQLSNSGDGASGHTQGKRDPPRSLKGGSATLRCSRCAPQLSLCALLSLFPRARPRKRLASVLPGSGGRRTPSALVLLRQSPPGLPEEHTPLHGTRKDSGGGSEISPPLLSRWVDRRSAPDSRSSPSASGVRHRLSSLRSAQGLFHLAGGGPPAAPPHPSLGLPLPSTPQSHVSPSPARRGGGEGATDGVKGESQCGGGAEKPSSQTTQSVLHRRRGPLPLSVAARIAIERYRAPVHQLWETS